MMQSLEAQFFFQSIMYHKDKLFTSVCFKDIITLCFVITNDYTIYI